VVSSQLAACIVQSCNLETCSSFVTS